MPLAAQASREVASGSEAYVYEIERLQNATPPGETPLDLDTPLGLLESFMAAGEREEWSKAAAALDLANVEGSSREPEVLAAELYDLLNRSLVVDWGSLPDRPDAVDTKTTSKDPMVHIYTNT